MAALVVGLLVASWLGVIMLAGIFFVLGCGLAAWYTRPADLLTVVLHEMGHLVGADDGGDGLMAAVLPEGTRRTDALDAVFGGA